MKYFSLNHQRGLPLQYLKRETKFDIVTTYFWQPCLYSHIKPINKQLHDKQDKDFTQHKQTTDKEKTETETQKKTQIVCVVMSRQSLARNSQVYYAQRSLPSLKHIFYKGNSTAKNI